MPGKPRYTVCFSLTQPVRVDVAWPERAPEEETSLQAKEGLLRQVLCVVGVPGTWFSWLRSRQH